MPKIKHKFNAVRVVRDGFKFPSKAEAKRYDELKLLQRAGEVVMFLRQVPFHIPGGARYECDYVVFWADGSVTVEDVKGYETDIFKLKKKLVEHHYPIAITLLTAAKK